MKKHEGCARFAADSRSVSKIFSNPRGRHTNTCCVSIFHVAKKKNTPVAEIRLKHKTNQIAFNETVIVSNLVSFLFLSHQPFVVRRSKTKREHTRIRRNTHFFFVVLIIHNNLRLLYSHLETNPTLLFIFCSVHSFVIYKANKY